MRRSGSSSCLLRPKSEVDLKTLESFSSNSQVTLVNTQSLPTYSTERFYMLSELEVHAHSTLFLCDAVRQQDDETLDTAESSLETMSSLHVLDSETAGVSTTEAETSTAPLATASALHPPGGKPFMILYMLWRQDEASSRETLDNEEEETTEEPSSSSIENRRRRAARAVCQGLIQETVLKLQEYLDATTPAILSAPPIYLVLDTVLPSLTQPEDVLAQELVQTVAQSPALRHALAGVTVGVTNHVRAAPGLEACLRAVEVGGRLRRRSMQAKSSKPTPGTRPLLDSKSWLQLVTSQPEDLLGMNAEEQETDAAQGVVQYLVCAEWNGNGNLTSFAKRSQSAWCREHGVLDEQDEAQEKGLSSKERRRKRRHKTPTQKNDDVSDPVSSIMVFLVLAYAAISFWGMYGEFIMELFREPVDEDLKTTTEEKVMDPSTKPLDLIQEQL